MSESSTMGLFGSKDDNTQTTDTNKDAVKPNHSLQERNAPYNIDSDSETYDTESLSMLDINDIIGIQAESAGDSTLESEFAALSQVITDTKSDEVASRTGGVLVRTERDVGRGDGNRDGGSSKDKGLAKNTSKDDTPCRSTEHKLFNFAAVAGINKSLQLIGESYISDDSQDTDNDGSVHSNVTKSGDVAKSLEVAKEEVAECATESFSGTVAGAGEEIPPNKTIVDECFAKCEEVILPEKTMDNKCSTESSEVVTANEPAVKASEPEKKDLKSLEIEKSTDATDSPAADVSGKLCEERNETEMMDVDSVTTQDVVENISVGKSSCNEPEEPEIVKTVVEDPTPESAVLEPENSIVGSPIKVEEPMEVDDTNQAVSDEVVTEKSESVVTEDVVEGKSEPSAPIVTEEAESISEKVGQPDESQKSIDQDSTIDDNQVRDIEAAENIPSTLQVEVSKPEESNLPTKVVESPKTHEIEPNQSPVTSKDEEITTDKLEMETDETQSVNNFEANSPATKIIETLTGKVKPTCNDTTKGEETKISIEQVKDEPEASHDSVEQSAPTEKHDEPIVESVKVLEVEPMQVDDHTAYYKTDSDDRFRNSPDLSINVVEIVEPIRNIVETLEHFPIDQLVDTSSNAPFNSPDIIETAKFEVAANVTQHECVSEETIVSSSVSEKSAEIGEPDSTITLTERVEIESSVASELSDNTPKNQPVSVVELEIKSEDKSIASEPEASGVSSTVDEAMEIEDTATEDNSKDELPSVETEIIEKSSEVVTTVPDIGPSEHSVSATEGTSEDDEKMEVDAGAKRNKLEDEDNVRQLDSTLQEPQSSLVSTVVEEHTEIETASESDVTENIEITVEETVEIYEESVDDERIEIGGTKMDEIFVETQSVDETDVAEQVENADGEDKVAPTVIEEGEPADEEANKIVIPTVIEEGEPPIKEVNEVIASNIPESTMPEVMEDEKAEVTSEKKNEDENSISNERSESTSKHVTRLELTGTPDKTMDETEVEENESFIPTTTVESPSGKVHGIEAVEILDDVMEENVSLAGDTDEQCATELNEDQTVLEAEIKTSEASDAMIGETENDEAAAIMMEETAEGENEEAAAIIVERNVEAENEEAAAIMTEETAEGENDGAAAIMTEETAEGENDQASAIMVEETAEGENDQASAIMVEETAEGENDQASAIIVEETAVGENEEAAAIIVEETAVGDNEEAAAILTDETAENENDEAAATMLKETVRDENEEAAVGKNEKAAAIVIEETPVIENEEAAAIAIEETPVVENEEAAVGKNEEAAVGKSEEAAAMVTEENPVGENTEAAAIMIEETVVDENEEAGAMIMEETAVGENTEAAAIMTEETAVGENEEATAIIMEDTKESLLPVDRLEETTAISEIQTASPSNVVKEREEDENELTQLMESAVIDHDSPETIQAMEPIETIETTIIEDANTKMIEDKNDSESESIKGEEESLVLVECNVEVSEKLETDDSRKNLPEIIAPIDVQAKAESCTSISEPGAELCTSIPEPEVETCTSITEQEAESCISISEPEADLPNTNRCDMLSSSINPDDVEGEEDPVEEEMNLSLDPEITEYQQPSSPEIDEKETQQPNECPTEEIPVETEEMDEKEAQQPSEFPMEEIPVEPEEMDEKEAQQPDEFPMEEIPVDTEEMEDHVDIDLSLDPEEKDDDSTSLQDEPMEKLIVEDSVDDSSSTFVPEKPEQTDERLEKPAQDENDDDTKTIISTVVVHETEMFHDEQSQNTQEMMDSILETDSSNFNKILDDEEDATLACANELPLGETEIDELTDKLPSESEELLNKALDDPMSSQNMDSLEGLLDLDLIQESDESTLKSVDPIVAKVMNEADDDIETKDVDVSLLLGETDQAESMDRDDYPTTDGPTNEEVISNVIVEEDMKISATDENLSTKSDLEVTVDSHRSTVDTESEDSSTADNDMDAGFDLPIDEPETPETDPLTSERSKLELAEDLLREIAVDEERKMKLAENFLMESIVEKDEKIDIAENILLRTTARQQDDENLTVDVLMNAAVDAERRMELVKDVLLDSPIEEASKIVLTDALASEIIVRDEVLTVAADIEDLPANSEISELESAVKFLQESEDRGIDVELALSPKMVESVVDEITVDEDVGLFVTADDITEDPTVLASELDNIIADPIAISEAEIITEAAKLESEKKSKITEESSKLRSPSTIEDVDEKNVESSQPIATLPEVTVVPLPETPKSHRESRLTTSKINECEKIDESTIVKKSAILPKISILEERLKEPPKIEIPTTVEVPRMYEMPSTPKTSLLIQRDSKMSNFQKMLESPKSTDKIEHKIVDTPRKDADKHDFENVGSPRIILKIAKSAIADCGEPRSPKSPKIRSATNSPNPEDSPGHKLGKIKLKLSKSGHPSIILNENVDEVCGQWHTEGTSSLSPLGMKIKFSKITDPTIVQPDKHEITEETKEPTKHKFEEAKRTDSPIGMKIKFSKTGDASIVQQDAKESTSKHKEKLESAQSSPKRNESPIGMKIKFSKSGDASIIQPEKTEFADDHRDATSRMKDKIDIAQDAPRRTESPLGMKFKLFKTGDASIVATETIEDTSQEVKRTDSPLGMKIKLSKMRGSATIVQPDGNDDNKDRSELSESPRRTESPLGMKIKFSKTGDASIMRHSDDPKEGTTSKHRDRTDTGHDFVLSSECSIGLKIKSTKTKDIAQTMKTEVGDDAETSHVTQKRSESSIGMKFKLSKTGDASIVHSETQAHVETSRNREKFENTPESVRKSDPGIGMKIKFSKTGDASIVHPQLAKRQDETLETDNEHQRSLDNLLAMKIKLPRTGEIVSITESEKKDNKTIRRKDTDSPLEMKIKLSKTGHPTIVACENYGESSQRAKEFGDSTKHKESSSSTREMPGMKMLKSMHGGIHGNRGELTIEPIHLQTRKSDGTSDPSQKRKDVTISPIESKKTKMENKLSHVLPEVTIQPIIPREPKQSVFDGKTNSISRQQMNVISQEISITQVRSNKAMDLTMTDKLKNILSKNATTSANQQADCEIIEHRPELIIVNENSNSSQDVMIIEELPALRGPEVKVPKKRGRPRRNPLPIILSQPMLTNVDATIPRDPLALDSPPHSINQMPSSNSGQMVMQNLPPKENERPKRSCSRQKSYAPPRRGRRRGGGGRGKRKLDMGDHAGMMKKPRLEQDLDVIEESTTALITIDDPPVPPEIAHTAPELYKALRQPPMDHKMANAMARVEAEQAVNEIEVLTETTRECLMDSRIMSHLDGVMENSMNKTDEPVIFETERKMSLDSACSSEDRTSVSLVCPSEQTEKIEVMIVDEKIMEKTIDDVKDIKDAVIVDEHQNWLTPTSKRLLDGRHDGNISNVQVIDEETRMSAESGSRSQTPARNMSLQAPETIVNEESQGSVLSTATTESEKVKVKNRRMEISFDPDEGPFTVDKIAEYEWPLDPGRKGETFMIQEQISQYLGVKSFKRKYPDLKRRMVDMEERNYLRENALVSEAMCDMGLTAVSSSEVLDVMCNDFPDQYEEYRKYIRERQMKEHFKKQKELTAAANAEKNRIDLAEMAVQSALSWNVGLNKARRESRKCSLDLQTFTIHVPKKQQKVEEESRQSNYPVALIPGQYTDYYREYTPAELRYYPLNTVLYGPMKPNERKLDSQSEGSQSDSDSDSSSDDSSSSSSDGTQDTEESQSTMDEVDVELSRQKEDIKTIKCKMCLKHLNKLGKTEILIQCGTCNGYVHPSCIDLTLDMVPHIQAYAWQCTDCKTCAQCHDPADEDKMLFCDMCDRGYHIYCVGLRRVPQGRWHCQECAVCASCGSREAGGANSDRNSVAQWQHEYKKGDKNSRVYVSTLCVPCSKLWRKGRYCPHCSRCHTVPRLDLEANLVHCSACDKYLHLGCVETKDLTIDRKNYLCDFCQPTRQQMTKPLVSKVFRT